MRDALRHFIAEFVGVFALVFVGSGAIMMARHTNAATPLILAATAHGLILAVMVTATMRISGHLNPAVTLAFLVTRRIEPLMAAIYICAQILGAIAAAYALKATVPADLFAATRGGGQSIALDVTATQGFVLEMIATFFLAFVVFGTAVDPNAPKVGGFAIGLTVANLGDADKSLGIAAVLLYFIVSAIAVIPYLKWMSGRIKQEEGALA